MKRLEWWKLGELDELLEECTAIQQRMRASKRKQHSDIKGFTRLMLEGKVKQALKLVDEDSGIIGVHELMATPKRNLS